MSVMACSRKKCTNVMCNRISYEYGYICNECFSELVKKGAETNIGEFMDSPKSKTNEDASQARFEIEFPLVRD